MADRQKDVLLVSEAYLKRVTNISDNVDGNYILPAIRFAQNQYLEEVIGTALVEKLQDLVYNEDLDNDNYQTLLDDYICDYLSYMAIADIITYTSGKITNFGASKTDDEKQYALSANEIEQQRNFYIEKANYVKYRMQRYLIANFSDFPELSSWTSVDKLQQNLYSAAGCSIWLGGARGKGVEDNYIWRAKNLPNSNNNK